MKKPTALTENPAPEEETAPVETPETPETPAEETPAETPEEETPETPAAPEETTAPAEATAGKPGIFENLRAAVTGKGQLLADNKRLASELATARASMATITGERDTLAANLATVTKERDLAQSQLTDLNKAVNSELETIGIAPKALPNVTGPDASDLLAQFEALSGAERISFFRKHEKALFRAAK
jgi:hypothetical protein